jgi:hypothetical protein
MQVFQLSAVSQNDPGAADGAAIHCTVTNIRNGNLSEYSLPAHLTVVLPIPPVPNEEPPTTPTWFLRPTGDISDTSIDVELTCPLDSSYPTTKISVTGSEVIKWAEIGPGKPPNQIYQNGVYGVFGFAQIGPMGPIYTVTAGVLSPHA